MQFKRSKRLKAYFLRARWFIYNCTTYLSSNWVVNLTNASAVSVQLSSTLKKRYSLQLEWQHKVYSVHSQHRAIQGDNYNVSYYSQLSLWWILFELVSILDTCLSYTKSHEWNKEIWWWFSGVHFGRCPSYQGVQKERGDCTHITQRHPKKQYHEPVVWQKNTFYQPKFHTTLCCAVSSLLTDTSERKPPP